MMNEKIEIVFMRHGRSRADDEEVHEGRYDAPLTNLGRAQAERRAAELRETGIGFDAIIASPLKRARETAQIVSDVLDIGVELDKDWMEKDNGPLAGLPYHVAGASYPIPAFHNPFQPHVVSADAEKALGHSTVGQHERSRGSSGVASEAISWLHMEGFSMPRWDASSARSQLSAARESRFRSVTRDTSGRRTIRTDTIG